MKTMRFKPLLKMILMQRLKTKHKARLISSRKKMMEKMILHKLEKSIMSISIKKSIQNSHLLKVMQLRRKLKQFQLQLLQQLQSLPRILSSLSLLPRIKLNLQQFQPHKLTTMPIWKQSRPTQVPKCTPTECSLKAAQVSKSSRSNCLRQAKTTRAKTL